MHPDHMPRNSDRDRQENIPLELRIQINPDVVPEVAAMNALIQVMNWLENSGDSESHQRIAAWFADKYDAHLASKVSPS